VAKKLLFKLLKWLAFFLALLAVIGMIGSYFVYKKILEELPDVNQLKEVHYQIPLQIFSKDGVLIAEFGEKKRTPITIDKVPKNLIHAFISAEDDSFETHPGVDYKGIIRAAIQLALTGKKSQGGSTITMQVTRNFLLTSEKTFIRKIKEIILALQIEQTFSKDKILELYLNKIYLGHRSYGVVAAAQTYFGKSLDELTIAESAIIAGLPKAPSLFNPFTNEARALERRNYVLRRMHELNHINAEEFETALKQPNTAKPQKSNITLSAPFVAEMVRKKIVEQYGEDAYNSGMRVYTTITQPLQTTANHALRNTLHAYDERHGYRYAAHTALNKKKHLFTELPTVGDCLPAIITQLGVDAAIAQLQNGTAIVISWENMKWAKRYISRDARGPSPEYVSQVLKNAEVIYVRQLEDQSWRLAQVPEAEAAFVALNPYNGAVMALSGGYDFYKNKFNRAVQSIRQPGSGFKPVIYTAALENGYTAATQVNDAPIVIADPSQANGWRPENYNKKFRGPTPLRTALKKSINLISVRILQQIGVDKAIETALRFGFTEDQLPKTMSLALGAGKATPMQMARLYAVFANGGFLIEPFFIERIESSEGQLLFQTKPVHSCSTCAADDPFPQPGTAPRAISPQINFIMNSMLRDVIQSGTATRAKVLGRQDLAGKTGTTNDQRDAWFNGYNNNVAATAWIGFDNTSPLGSKETGGAAALPMWIDFMRYALEGIPETPLTPPDGIIKRFIGGNHASLAPDNAPSGTWEYFDATRSETIPSEISPKTSKPTTNSNEDKSSVEALF